MASAYSGTVNESVGGWTRAYVEAWVSSENDKQATIYVRGCANAWRLAQWGVGTRCWINGQALSSNRAVIWAAGGEGNFAWCEGWLTVNKSSGGHNVSCACELLRESVDGYGAITGTATAYVDVWVGAAVLRPPSAPSELQISRNAAASIDLKWKVNAGNALTTQVERLQKGGTWLQIADIQGSPSSYTDSPGIGTFKYRVRNWNTDGFSGYSNETDYIVTLCAPAAPTIVSPPSGSTVNANEGSAALAWRHNPIDSSAQTTAEITYSYDNESWEETSVLSEQQIIIPLQENKTIVWQVRTKGAHADFGSWSAVSSFLVRTAPVAVLSIPNPVNNVPIPISWEYDDAIGTQIAAELSVLDDVGTALFEKTLTAENSYTIAASEFTPINGQAYTVELRVTSSTSLAYSTKAVFEVHYEPPTRPNFSTEVDPTSASVKLSVFAGESDIQTRAMSVFRDGMLIAENLMNGQSCIDTTPPLDTNVNYRVVAYAPSGAVAESLESLIVPSKGFVFFNFKNTYTKMAMTLSSKDSTKGDRVLKEVASSALPKAFYGSRKRRTGSESADVWWLEDLTNDGKEAMLDRIKELKEYNGSVYMRRPFDEPLKVCVDVSYNVRAGDGGLSSVSVNWEATA